MNKISQNTPEANWPRSNGMTVPDGYFEDFANRMMAQIPAESMRPQPVVVKRSFWQIIRPYTYMAAMFAGIWLMMQVFAMIGNASKSAVESTQASSLYAEVVNQNTISYINDYVSMSDYDLYDDLYESGFELNN